jgi:hypothetical protein
MSFGWPALVSCVLVLGGCAAAQPGYSPLDKAGPFDRVKPFESGSVDAAGHYTPSPAERALDCRKLTGSMRVIITRLRDAGNRPQPSAATTMMSDAATAVTGRPRHMDMAAELRREQGRLAAFNKLLAEKGCPTVDVPKELAK